VQCAALTITKRTLLLARLPCLDTTDALQHFIEWANAPICGLDLSGKHLPEHSNYQHGARRCTSSALLECHGVGQAPLPLSVCLSLLCVHSRQRKRLLARAFSPCSLFSIFIIFLPIILLLLSLFVFSSARIHGICSPEKTR
jgi:hypothetical protein